MLMHKLFISTFEYCFGVRLQKASHFLAGPPLLWSSVLSTLLLCSLESSLSLVFSLDPRSDSRKAWTRVGLLKDGLCGCLLDAEAGLMMPLYAGGSWCWERVGCAWRQDGHRREQGERGHIRSVPGCMFLPRAPVESPTLSQLGFIGLQLNSQLSLCQREQFCLQQPLTLTMWYPKWGAWGTASRLLAALPLSERLVKC